MNPQTAAMPVVTPPVTERVPPSKKFDRVARVVDRVFGVAFCLVVLLNFLSAAGRYLGGHAFIGSDEVQVYTMVWLIFLGAAAVSLRQTHLRMDVLVNKLGPRPAYLRSLLEAALTACVCGLMSWVSLGFTLQIREMGQHSDGAGIPMWIPHASVVVGFVLMTLCAVFSFARLLQHHRAG
jgi:TRAP-type C4-dicarboxylate transport system permease small subunit